ncbi:Fanconi anemia group D2 protein-like [Oncorhynchus kisutch]|uniref:Fanconi anemia group D2 protein-like n=1 Tax=Oncorhynchus kisutch TaxID=8019 RepID=UPI00099FEFF1|nr:Fanconi anemia group D2 protein-like [Oncorhynchus kisutch]
MMHKKRPSVEKSESAAPPDVSKPKKSKTTGHHPRPLLRRTPIMTLSLVNFCARAGVILRKGSISNEIAVEQMVFQKRLQQRLKKSPRYPGIVQELIKGLESHIEDPERFRNCLLPVYHAWPMAPAALSVHFRRVCCACCWGIKMLQV